MPYKLTVNGKSTTVDVPGDMPLLWVIRDVLNLKATKFGCGIGQCGACTVHVRGRAASLSDTSIGCGGCAHYDDRRAIGRRFASAAAGMAGARRPAMRLLPGRSDHVSGGAALDDAKAYRRRDQHRNERQFVPLRHLHAPSRGRFTTRRTSRRNSNARPRRRRAPARERRRHDEKSCDSSLLHAGQRRRWRRHADRASTIPPSCWPRDRLRGGRALRRAGLREDRREWHRNDHRRTRRLVRASRTCCR